MLSCPECFRQGATRLTALWGSPGLAALVFRVILLVSTFRMACRGCPRCPRSVIYRREGAGSIPRYSLAACRGMLEDKRTGVVRSSLAGTVSILPSGCRRVKRPRMSSTVAVRRHRCIERAVQVQCIQGVPQQVEVESTILHDDGERRKGKTVRFQRAGLLKE